MLLLKTSLNKIESIKSFDLFLEDGINYVLQRERDNASSNSSNPSRVELPVGTVERMRDLQCDVKKLLKSLDSGMKNSNAVFSTQAEDYC